MALNDGLEEVVLPGPYGDHPAGSKLRVSTRRKLWILENIKPENPKKAKPLASPAEEAEDK